MLGALLQSSCNDESIEMGDVHYYPSFLWCDAKMDTLVKVYDFDFNADAKADPLRYAEFKFVDNNGDLISQDEIIVYVDGAKTRDNTFIVKSNITYVDRYSDTGIIAVLVYGYTTSDVSTF